MNVADPHVIACVVAAVFGLLIGSFVGVVADRVPRKESIVRPSSHCTACAAPLRTIDNATLDPRTLVEWMMADGIPARLSLQIHKFIWEPMKKGV